MLVEGLELGFDGICRISHWEASCCGRGVDRSLLKEIMR
jgi:hypothetical protein